MAQQKCGEYTLIEQLSSDVKGVDHWLGKGPDGVADIYLGGPGLVERAASLPKWGPFADYQSGLKGKKGHIIVPGVLAHTLGTIGSSMDPEVCLGIALHIATAVAEMHERGESHGGLHPDHVGIDEAGWLVIRPSLGSEAIAEMDEDASAQATDCLHFAALFAVLDLDRMDDSSVGLVDRGLRRELARRRIQPGRAVRQSLSAVLHRHPSWEASIQGVLGDGWGLDDNPWSERSGSSAVIVEVVADIDEVPHEVPAPEPELLPELPKAH